MKRYAFKNGLTVIYEKRESETVAIEITIKTGSNNETEDINGIAHFIEHLVFEGTKKRKTNREIANEIEKFGGELNAYTSTENTSFFIKIQSKHFEKALDILSDILINPLFEKKAIEKERQIILKEINLIKDEPRFHQWILFHKALYKHYQTKNPTYGTIESIKSITREDILNYYNKYYLANNTIISIVGGIKNPWFLLKKYFKNYKSGKIIEKEKIIEPKKIKIEKLIEERKVLSSYMVLGYNAVPRKSNDSYVLDIIRAILGRGQSGKLFIEIRSKRGLAYEIGVINESNIDYGYFAVYLGTDKENISKIINIILNEFKKLKNITEKELKEAKDFLEGEYILHLEDNLHMADELSFWEHVGNINFLEDYSKKIRKVTKKEIIRVVDEYFTKNYTLAVIEQG